MPVIGRDELLKVKAGRIGATMLVLVVEAHLLLEIQTQRILTTIRGLSARW
jgi:hypothetical protein